MNGQKTEEMAGKEEKVEKKNRRERKRSEEGLNGGKVEEKE